MTTLAADAPPSLDLPPIDPKNDPKDSATRPAGDGSVTSPADAQRRPGRPPGGKDSAPKRSPGRPTKDDELRSKLDAMLGTIGVSVMVVNPTDGQIILAGAGNLADALTALAKENPSVRRTLEQLLTVSAWGQVLTAVAAIAVPIMANHGLVPDVFGALAEAQTQTPPAPADGA